MELSISEYLEKDIIEINKVWNDAVITNQNFPYDNELTEISGKIFFAKHDFVGVVKVDYEIVGLYILAPNSIGHCKHQASCYYVLKPKYIHTGIGEQLIEHSLAKAKELGFEIMVLKVVSTNEDLIEILNHLGFIQDGKIPNGYKTKKGNYLDMLTYYYMLANK